MSDKISSKDYNARTNAINRQTEASIRKTEFFEKKQESFEKNQLNSKISNSLPNTGLKGLGILGIVILLLIIASFFRVTSNLPNASFTDLINALANAPNFTTTLTIPSIIIGEVPVILEFLFSVINSFVSIFNFILWLVGSMLQLLTYCFYFLSWLLGIPI